MNKYEKMTLSNGIKLILVPNEATGVSTVMVMYGVGSRDEEEKYAGISHLLEHMHYMGTKRRPTSLDLAEFIESVGGQHNAFTGKEYTGYYAKVTPKHIEHAFDFLSDNLLNSELRDKDIDHERAVINQEINMYEDLPHEVCSNKFEEVVLGKNALGREIIGTKKSLEAVTHQVLLNYKKSHYFGQNITIVIAGNPGEYSREELLVLTEKYFGAIPAGEKSCEKIELNNAKNLEIIKKDTAQAQISIGFKTCPMADKDTFILDLLSTILGGAMSSRMFEEIREKRQLAYTVHTGASAFVESGFLTTQAGVNEGKTLEAIEAIINEYKKIKEEKVPEKELDKAKEIICGKLMMRLENSEDLAYHYASDQTLLDKIHTPKELINIYRGITADDILEVARKYFTDDRMGLCFVGKDLDADAVGKIFSI